MVISHVQSGELTFGELVNLLSLRLADIYLIEKVSLPDKSDSGTNQY